MADRWLTRALVAVAVPALLVPALSSSAAAAAAPAPKPPAVPTLDAVARIYPHLEGGSADVRRERKVRMPEESCDRGSVITGASGQEAMYGPDLESMEDVEEFEVTGEKPMVGVTADVFPTARVASQFLRAARTEGMDCEQGDEVLQMKKIRFRLGSERWGFQVKMGTKKHPMFANLLVVRSGKRLVVVTSVSITGKAAPSIAKSVDLTRLALETAR